MADPGIIANLKDWPIGKSSAENDRTLAVKSNIIADDDVALAPHPMNITVGVQPASVLLAVGFEQRLANENTEKRIIDAANRYVDQQNRLEYDARRWHAERQGGAASSPHESRKRLL